MAAAYPVELRIRVVEAFNNGEGTYDEIASRFRVGRASVTRCSVEPKPNGGARHERRIGPEGEEFIRAVLEEIPDTTIPSWWPRTRRSSVLGSVFGRWDVASTA